MEFETILIKNNDWGMTITLNRPEHRNSLNQLLLNELNQALDITEENSNCKIVILKGHPGFFCIGQDFEEISNNEVNKTSSLEKAETNPYLNILNRFTSISKILISIIDGQVMAGGVGLAAASDLVIATPRSQFVLSEALWGLIPAIVFPFLMRRVGFQSAYRMALTSLPFSAKEAYENHLVDQINEMPEEIVHRWWLRLSHLDESTISHIKRFVNQAFPIGKDMEKLAVSKSLECFSDPKVVQNISNYVKYKKFPWEK